MVALTREILAQLPPCERDFDVFAEVVVAGGSTREAAAKFGISQTRVCQLVKRVWRWQEGVLPRIDADLSPEMLLKAGRYIASDRLNHLYSLVMRSFEKSQRDQVKRRINAHGDEITTTTSSCGDPKYLNAAIRITMAHVESGIPMGLVPASLALAADKAEEILTSPAWREVAEVGASDGQGAAKSSSCPDRAADESENPPARACSENAAEGSQNAPSAAANCGAKSEKSTTSKRLTRRQKRARKTFFGPVQPAAEAGVSQATMQLKLSPELPGASVEVLADSETPLQRQSA